MFDYKSKYLKYKLKYLQLKKYKLGGSEESDRMSENINYLKAPRSLFYNNMSNIGDNLLKYTIIVDGKTSYIIGEKFSEIFDNEEFILIPNARYTKKLDDYFNIVLVGAEHKRVYNASEIVHGVYEIKLKE